MSDFHNFNNVPHLKDGNWLEFSEAMKIHLKSSDQWKTVQFASLLEYYESKFTLIQVKAEPLDTSKSTSTSDQKSQVEQQPKQPLVKKEEGITSPSAKPIVHADKIKISEFV